MANGSTSLLRLIVRDQDGAPTPFRADWHLPADGGLPFRERLGKLKLTVALQKRSQ